MSSWIIRQRFALYVLLNVLIFVGAPLLAQYHGGSTSRAIYGAALFCLCSSPLLLLRSLASRYILLALFMGTYFLHFGALDLESAFRAGTQIEPSSVLPSVNLAVLLGGLILIIAYVVGDRLGRPSPDRGSGAEWPVATLMCVGLLLWTVGTIDTLYYQVVVIPDKTNATTQRGLAQLGAYLTFTLLLLQLLQPLGLLMLAYGYARRRNLLWMVVVIAVVVVQIGVGFITDVKATALFAGLIVVVTRIFVDRKLPAGWVLACLAFVVFAFPVFQAYRTEVTGERGLNRFQALMQLDKVVEIALASAEKEQHPAQDRPQTFVERAYIKDNLAAVMDHAGVDTPLLHGKTLIAIPMAFVPRVLAPDKESISVGQLFTRQIAKSDLDTYISISHLGEMYWNFGWPGMLIGMLITGVILGVIGARSSIEHGPSMTRVMVLVATVQTLCVGFEGEISNSYVVLMRSLAAIGLLHLAFARRVDVRTENQSGQIPSSTPAWSQVGVVAGLQPRFPNVMR